MRAWQIKHIRSEAAVASSLISAPHNEHATLETRGTLISVSGKFRFGFIPAFKSAFQEKWLLIGNKVDDPFRPSYCPSADNSRSSVTADIHDTR